MINCQLVSPCRVCDFQPKGIECSYRQYCRELDGFRALLDVRDVAENQPSGSSLEYSTYMLPK